MSYIIKDCKNTGTKQMLRFFMAKANNSLQRKNSTTCTKAYLESCILFNVNVCTIFATKKEKQS